MVFKKLNIKERLDKIDRAEKEMPEVLHADSLEEWLALPANKRFGKFGFYITPIAMEWGEWDNFHEWCKKHHPIQYFFTEVFPYWFKIPMWRINDKFYYLKCLFFKRYHILKLRDNPTWIDVSHKVELALEKLLIEFVEGEDPWEMIDWESNDDHSQAAKELKWAYDFFKIQRPLLQKAIDDKIEALFGGKDFKFNSTDPVREAALIVLREEESTLEKLEDKAFRIVVDYRRFLWT